eukprot:NODE_2679_length_2167_cov_2.524020.p1 GENE.NODE_2679_length_2167_cov_2.524020~~NODE_2679_length_2167_cov_2.524020.p1  ORF type:complete len:455 (+),score=151.94 NODE_2679_length_2167_cov_2.524020:3-1367(+)
MLVTPSYDLIEQIRVMQLEQLEGPQRTEENQALPEDGDDEEWIPVGPPPDAAIFASPSQTARLRELRDGAGHGVLHFAGLAPDEALPLTYSRGMPEPVVATWDGVWVARTAFGAGLRQLAAVTAPLLALPAPAPELAACQPAASVVPAIVAELASSLGYLRFSHPVIVRTLFARWAPPAGARPAIIVGRLGVLTVWKTHLEPSRLDTSGWVDVSGAPLSQVDEIVFMATPGLEIAAVEVAVHVDGDDADAAPQTVMLLARSESEEAQWGLNTVVLPRATAPFVVSVQEALERNLRFRTDAERLPGGLRAPGVLTSRSPTLLPDEKNRSWLESMALTEAILEHRLIFHLLGPSLNARGPESVKAVAELLPVFMGHDGLPDDLRKLLRNESSEIVETIVEWLHNGGNWKWNAPLSLPRRGTDAAVKNYVDAKRGQTRLDLMTASFLYLQDTLPPGP